MEPWPFPPAYEVGRQSAAMESMRAELAANFGTPVQPREGSLDFSPYPSGLAAEPYRSQLLPHFASESRAGLVRGLTEIVLEFRGEPPWPHWDADCRSVTEVRQR